MASIRQSIRTIPAVSYAKPTGVVSLEPSGLEVLESSAANAFRTIISFLQASRW